MSIFINDTGWFILLDDGTKNTGNLLIFQHRVPPYTDPGVLHLMLQADCPLPEHYFLTPPPHHF
jgi:hypothetical protein